MQFSKSCVVKCFFIFSLVFLTACASNPLKMEEPTVDVVSIEPLTDTNRPRFKVGLRMVNPNKKDIKINGVVYTLSVKGHKLVTGATASEATLPAYGEANVDVEAEISFLRMLGLLGDVMRTNQMPLDYYLTGKVDLGGFMFPIKINKKGKLDADFFNGFMQKGLTN